METQETNDTSRESLSLIDFRSLEKIINGETVQSIKEDIPYIIASMLFSFAGVSVYGICKGYNVSFSTKRFTITLSK